MAKFSDLPNELIIEIWSHVLQPRDIENFASVSKMIRSLSGKTLLEHRKLTRQFSTFEIGGPNSRSYPAGLLKEILTNPRVALYIKHVFINYLHDNWESKEKGVNTLMAFDPEAGENGPHYRHTPYADEDMELFKQAMKRSRQFLHFSEEKNTCQCTRPDAEYPIGHLNENIEHGYNYPIVILLLLLLTNLKSITVERSRAEWFFFEILRYISEGEGIAILKRQIEVKILHVCDDEAKNHVCRSIHYALPSVRTFHNDIPGKVVHDDCFSFDIRAWSSDVDGNLIIK